MAKQITEITRLANPDPHFGSVVEVYDVTEDANHIDDDPDPNEHLLLIYWLRDTEILFRLCSTAMPVNGIFDLQGPAKEGLMFWSHVDSFSQLEVIEKEHERQRRGSPGALPHAKVTCFGWEIPTTLVRELAHPRSR